MIKQIYTFTSNMLFEQRRFGLGCPSLYQVKAGATKTETSLRRQYVAGECVDLLDDYDFPARTITEFSKMFSFRIQVSRPYYFDNCQHQNSNYFLPSSFPKVLLSHFLSSFFFVLFSFCKIIKIFLVLFFCFLSFD